MSAAAARLRGTHSWNTWKDDHIGELQNQPEPKLFLLFYTHMVHVLMKRQHKTQAYTGFYCKVNKWQNKHAVKPILNERGISVDLVT